MLNKILISSLILFFVVIYFQYLYAESLKKDNLILSSEIDNLKAQSKIAKQRMEEINKAAIINMQQSKIDAKQIMMANVSSTCKKAIDWGIQEAKEFKS